MLYQEKLAAWSETRTKRVNTLRGQKAEFLVLHLMVTVDLFKIHSNIIQESSPKILFLDRQGVHCETFMYKSVFFTFKSINAVTSHHDYSY
jgi:hypothetical protein